MLVVLRGLTRTSTLSWRPAIPHVSHETDRACRTRNGQFYPHESAKSLFYNLSATNERGTRLSDNKGEGANNFGIFAQDELALNNRLSLLFGARYDRIVYYYRSFLPTAPVRFDWRDFTRVSPKLGVNLRLGTTNSVYANVGGGIEAPAGNETDPVPGAPAPAPLLNPLLDAITSTTYEVGYTTLSQSIGDLMPVSSDAALYDTEAVGGTTRRRPARAGRVPSWASMPRPRWASSAARR